MTPEQMMNDLHSLLAHAVTEQPKGTHKFLQERSEAADPIANLLSEDESTLGDVASRSKLSEARWPASLEIRRRRLEKFPDKELQEEGT